MEMNPRLARNILELHLKGVRDVRAVARRHTLRFLLHQWLRHQIPGRHQQNARGNQRQSSAVEFSPFHFGTDSNRMRV